ncbi:CBS domain-containing protein [Brevundimonas sp. 2R-24]|uniref:CBS domain-containing protein n=1 Tax=Peiella sedimenti TaxID=3061083 RepID=A0ABT8SKE6_9CAUL|nr:CBS domain-containing protein [Caulobacteraceae bacterium XZ-24]
MLVTEILKDKGGAVHQVGPDATVSKAAGELLDRKVGAVVVTDGGRVAGIFSERDMVRAVCQDGASALERPVSDYMTRDVVTAEPSDTVDTLMARMTDRRIRHLPVVEHGRLTGIVSIGDLVKCKIAEATHEADTLRQYIAAG